LILFLAATSACNQIRVVAAEAVQTMCQDAATITVFDRKKVSVK
jgi:hypothetical protein